MEKFKAYTDYDFPIRGQLVFKKQEYNHMLFFLIFPELFKDGVITLNYKHSIFSPYNDCFDKDGCYIANKADWFDENKSRVRIYNTPSPKQSMKFKKKHFTFNSEKKFYLPKNDKMEEMKITAGMLMDFYHTIKESITYVSSDGFDGMIGFFGRFCISLKNPAPLLY